MARAKNARISFRHSKSRQANAVLEEQDGSRSAPLESGAQNGLLSVRRPVRYELFRGLCSSRI
jgi:hypothetical protein